MSGDDAIGFGVIGCGLVADFHGRALTDLPGARLVAAADVDPDRLGAFTARFQCNGYTDYRELLARPDVQVVNVCTPNHLHEAFVIAAADAGKHVMVEKPPEVTLEQSDRMIAACDAAGVRFATVLQVRRRAALLALKQAIDAGRFGRLLVADAHMKWYRDRGYFDRDGWRGARSAEAGGVVMQHAFHYIDLLRWLTGGVESVDARTYKLLHTDIAVEDTALAFFRYRCGAVGVLEASTGLYPGTEIRIEVHGEHGTVYIEGNRIREWRFKDAQPGDESMVQHDLSDPSAATGAADFGYLEHRDLLADMTAAVREGREPAVTGRDGRNSLAVVLAVYESARLGKPAACAAEI